MNYIEEYIRDIESGAINTCEKIKLQFSILKKQLEDSKLAVCVWGFDEDLGNHPIQFIETFCRHSKGEWMGKPVILELWQKAITQAIYGFYNKITGYRKYQEVLVVIARKNGKTTWAAGLALYGFLGEGEGGARVHCAANKLDQAKLLYSEAVNMLNQSPILKGLVKKTRTTLVTKEQFQLFAEFSPLAADSTTLDGLNPSTVIYDEIHAAKTNELYSVIKQGQSARRQPMNIQITTNGFVREGLFDEQYNFATDYLNGVYPNKENFLAFIFEQDSKEEIDDEKTWIKSNPNLGVSKSVEYIRNALSDAKAKPEEMQTVLTKDFNIPENSKDGWLDLKFLKFRKTYNFEEMKSQYCIGGVDLSNVLDLTCATLVYIDKADKEELKVIQQYFMPEDKLLEKKVTDKVPYSVWVEQGWITLCKGNIVDYSYITKWFKKMYKEKGLIPYWIGYDRWSATYWITEMQKEGFRKLESVIQGPKTFDPAMKYAKSLFEADKVNYNNNPVLRWCLTNVTVKRDEGNNMAPDKKHSNGRIDGAVSLLDAIVVLLDNKQDYYNLQKIK